MRNGIASDNCFTVRALAYIIAGHFTHHLAVLRERYFRALGAPLLAADEICQWAGERRPATPGRLGFKSTAAGKPSR